MGIDDVKFEDVLKELDVQTPDWVMRLADQQDFKDALRLDAERGKELLHHRASEKVWMVTRAYVVALLKKGGEG